MHKALAEAVDQFARGIAQSNRPEDRKLAMDYLAALAPLLASVVLGQDILREIDRIEHLFGNTFLVDPTPFESALAKWRQFRDEYERFVLLPMTVNERLSALDLEAAYESAKAAGDVADIRRILRRALLDEESITTIIEHNPGRPPL